MRERADQAGRTLGVAIERPDHLITGHAFLQRLRLEIRRDQGEGVVMRRAGRRTRSGVGRLLRSADAADKLVAGLGELALRKGGDGGRDAISYEMADAAGRPALRVEHQQRKAPGAFRWVRDGELRRNVLADAVGVGLVVAGELLRQPFTVLEVA